MLARRSSVRLPHAPSLSTYLVNAPLHPTASPLRRDKKGKLGAACKKEVFRTQQEVRVGWVFHKEREVRAGIRFSNLWVVRSPTPTHCSTACVKAEV